MARPSRRVSGGGPSGLPAQPRQGGSARRARSRAPGRRRACPRPPSSSRAPCRSWPRFSFGGRHCRSCRTSPRRCVPFALRFSSEWTARNGGPGMINLPVFPGQLGARLLRFPCLRPAPDPKTGKPDACEGAGVHCGPSGDEGVAAADQGAGSFHGPASTTRPTTALNAFRFVSADGTSTPRPLVRRARARPGRPPTRRTTVPKLSLRGPSPARSASTPLQWHLMVDRCGTGRSDERPDPAVAPRRAKKSMPAR